MRELARLSHGEGLAQCDFAGRMTGRRAPRAEPGGPLQSKPTLGEHLKGAPPTPAFFCRSRRAGRSPEFVLAGALSCICWSPSFAGSQETASPYHFSHSLFIATSCIRGRFPACFTDGYLS